MSRSVILGVCAASVASLLGGCVIVIGNEDDFDEGYHADWDVEFGDDRVVRDESVAASALLGDVRARFDEDAELRAQPILIAAQDGVVTLSGEVANSRILGRAVDVASQTPGADSVVLKMVVAVDSGAGR